MASVLLVRANVVNVGSNSEMPSTRVRFAFALVIGLAGPAVAQEPDVPPDASIRLQRTSCLGPCPIYTVTIDARGTVTYDGEAVRPSHWSSNGADRSVDRRGIAGEGGKDPLL